MKRYKLLKDLPFAKAGALFTRNTFKSKDGLSDYDYLETSILLDGNQDETVFGIKRNYFINNFDDWFEEVGEPEWVYYINEFGGDVNSVRVADIPRIRANLKSTGNYFETKEEAEKYLEYLKAKTIIKQDTKGFTPDWHNEEQPKHYGYCHAESKRLWRDAEYTEKRSTIYFKSIKDIEESLNNHPEEWKTYLTYEQ
nr:MAG TPA: hypothetical protein [Bacteriophage sp.]